MVIWINGPFGVGKTSIATALAKKWPRARIFDPEKIGFWLKLELRFKSLITLQKPPDNFQDIPEWRKRTLEEIILRLRTEKWPVIIPMTVVNGSYFKEILAPLCEMTDVYHFSLMAKPSTIKKRIRERLGRKSSKNWAIAQIDHCLANLKKPLFAMNIDTEGRSQAQVVKEILSLL